MKQCFRVVFILLVILSTGCDERELLVGITGEQSVELMVYLQRSGIEATREVDAKGSNLMYRVLVSVDDYPKALEVIHAYGLPKRKRSGLDSMLQARGLVPNTRNIEKFRLDYLLGLQLEKLLELLPGVVDVRTIIRTPEDNLEYNKTDYGSNAESNWKPHADIIIRYYSSSGKLLFSLDEVKEIALHAVPGLSKNNIELKLSRIFSPNDQFTSVDGNEASFAVLRPFSFRVYFPDWKIAMVQLLVLIIVTASISLITGFLIARDRKPR